MTNYRWAMAHGMNLSPIAHAVNSAAVALINAPVLGRFVGRGLVVIRYTGRRSGRVLEGG